MATSTPNYNFQLPTEGADNNTWGGMLNGNWSTTDTQLKATDDIAKQASSKATEADGKADQNALDIATNKDDIATNASNISANTAALGDKIDKTGGTMTGPLVLAGDPSADDEASRKKYVDDAIQAAIDAAIGGVVSPIASAATSANGTKVKGTGMSVTGSGPYVYTFDTPQADDLYHISVQPDGAGMVRDFTTIKVKTTTGFEVQFVNFNGVGVTFDHTVIVWPIT